MGPQLYLMLALALSGPVTYGVMWVKREWAVSQAYKQGKVDGEAAVTAKGVASAKDTVNEIRKAEAETPLPADKAAIIELCKKRASCRERGTVQ